MATNANMMELSTPAPYVYEFGSPGKLAVLVLSVVIPGLAILTCLITSIFLCYYRDRIPIFRNKAKKHFSSGAKTQVPLSGDVAGYPTQKSSAAVEEETVLNEDVEMKAEPIQECEVVVAVDVNQPSNE